MVARVMACLLLVAALLLQGQLWFSSDGFREVSRLEGLIDGQRAENLRLAGRNQRLEAEVRQLKEAAGAVEERARTDLGLVGGTETFYQFGAAVVPEAPARAAGR
ncbi:MAG: septum formation initiator family protein [Chromatiales bacterium]|jgi:cell division protein FtsB|nr:septum formation initiator family protein [Chromatiales bacterium]